MQGLRRFRALFLCLVTLLSLPLKADWYQLSAEVMTTKLQLEFWSESAQNVDKIKTSVLQRFEDIEALMSRYRPDSELSRVNQGAYLREVEVSLELFSLLEKSIMVSSLSHGAFDISFASVGYLYDYRANKQPSTQQLADSLPAIDYRNISLNSERRSVSFKSAGVVLDLGGIAKGYAVDEGIKVLKSWGITHARLSAGGDMYLLGDKRGKPWLVGVRDPRSKNENITLMPLSDTALSTSGDYERFFISEQGERIHHIISPKTGKPVRGLMSTSVLGPDATTTDALSTAIFVIGLDKGMALVNSLPGIDAVLVDENKVLHYTSGRVHPSRN